MSRKIGSRIDARITDQEMKWLEVYADRVGVTKSEALREGIRRLRVTEDDAVLAEVASLREEVECLKQRVGRLESRNRHLERKVYSLSKFTVAREAYEAVAERDRKLALMQAALEELTAADP